MLAVDRHDRIHPDAVAGPGLRERTRKLRKLREVARG